jgi:hypothetical protein
MERPARQLLVVQLCCMSALDNLLDILLRGSGRGMEHLTLALAVWRENTVEKQAVNMGGAPEVAGGAMNGADRAALAAGKSGVSCSKTNTVGSDCPRPSVSPKGMASRSVRAAH